RPDRHWRSETQLTGAHSMDLQFLMQYADLEALRRRLGMKYTSDVATYAQKHTQQFGTMIEVRKSKELHDRLIVVDDSDCWVTGGSVKQAGEKATYLLPLPPGVAEATRSIYS